MQLELFQDLVAGHSDWFRGTHHENSASISQAEARLAIHLPQALSWLLTSWGYSAASGIDTLAEAVDATLRCRSAFNLPSHYVVLNDWGDAGVVILHCQGPDPEEWPVYWAGAHNLHRLAEGETLDPDHERFSGFGEWVASRLAQAIDEAIEGP